ncbi:LOW QUALITY PROTEIN: myeloid differentiation primary response protein MyD88 [Cotesia typhae]|uniref:LOW QUALITY PROTEIN: myeloid differentiation primary response protein MyD88 n=1 Tax=Cotesia typhae TaxID=2053667 RepID=UPI003D6892B0
MADLSKVPLNVLSTESKFILSALLNPIKCIPTEDGYPRLEGVADLFSLGGELIPAISNEPDPVAFILNVATQKNPQLVIKDLQVILEKLERWDVFDDTQPVFDKDAQEYYKRVERNETSADVVDNDIENQILTFDDLHRVKTGLSTQRYDAFLVYADEDADFAQEIIENLEQKQNLKLFIKDRDFVRGIPFEHVAVMDMISERCNRLIVVLSPNFIKSSANDFIVKYAQGVGIKQNLRKIIPCLYEQCTIPKALQFMTLLTYNKSNVYFWKRLQDSIATVPIDTPKNELTSAKCEELISKAPQVPNTPMSQVSDLEASSTPEVSKKKSKFQWPIKQKSKQVTTKTLSSDDSQNDLIKLPSLEGLDNLDSTSISIDHTPGKQKKTKSMKVCTRKLKSLVSKKS